jgi:hypothetical protein
MTVGLVHPHGHDDAGHGGEAGRAHHLRVRVPITSISVVIIEAKLCILGGAVPDLAYPFRGYPYNSAIRRAISSRGTSSTCDATAHPCPNGSMMYPSRSP